MAQYARFSSLGQKNTIQNKKQPSIEAFENIQSGGVPEIDTSPPVMEIQNLEHRKKLLDSHFILVVALSADWCGPCKAMASSYNSMAASIHNQHSGKVRCVKENIDMKLPCEVEIGGVPAFIFYRAGKIVKDKQQNPVIIFGPDLKKVKSVIDQLLA